ncbi:mitochondrial chaperone BCS1-B [Phytophthora cinnamomi]|uniref:mitochondrial chaperone BCS1-B n=1 Tax=Phytophthora cinnamomi TaxID=4785 RepID=UPI00355993DA|nr:mitochondrial chaperone BCS1-B [Phytophthora cinnamomi]
MIKARTFIDKYVKNAVISSSVNSTYSQLQAANGAGAIEGLHVLRVLSAVAHGLDQKSGDGSKLQPLPRAAEGGVQCKHEIVEPEDKEEKNSKTLTETNGNFKFFSALPDGSERIDALIKRAFKNYQDMECNRYTEDMRRYYYIQTGGPNILDKRAQKENVAQLLDNFTNKAGKFAIKGFPYKLGLLLYGLPGTGKTIHITAVAQHTQRHIEPTSLGKIHTNQRLLDALFDMKFAV